MTTTTFRTAAAPRMFASVRGSRDLSLVAFGAALFTAFALHMGAFLPRLSSPEAPARAPAVQPATPTPVQAAVVAAQPVPCPVPRG